MSNWIEILKSDALERLGEKCTTTRELALALSKEFKTSVTVDSLFNAHKRHKDKLKLKDSIMDYMGRVEKEPPAQKLEDIKWELTKEKKAEIKKAKRFIITSAMNNCPVDPNFWASLQTYARKTKACLLVIPSRYKNPTSKAESEKTDAGSWWAQEVHPHMTDEQIKLNDHLRIMADYRVNATATNPLSGLDTISGGISTIFGHAQIQMKTVPTPQYDIPKIMQSTGSCTEPIYSDTRAGKRGLFNHSLGAAVVELGGKDKFFIRTISADNTGGFYDLDYYYGPKGAEKSSQVEALITGDEHAMFNDERNKAAVYLNKDSICNVLKPKVIVRHDVFDGYSISHHNRKDPMIQYSKHKMGHHLVKDELELTAAHIEETTPKFSENLIVASNHHDHLLRWLKEVTPLQEPWNLDTYLDLWKLVTETWEWKETGTVHGDPFALWMEERLKVKTTFLPRDSSKTICGIMVGFHGDQGANGARGSINQYAKMGAKTVLGHRHAPGINKGVYQVGTSTTLRMDYTSGPSSWAHCHCVVYPNGKRQLIFVIKGEWRAK